MRGEDWASGEQHTVWVERVVQVVAGRVVVQIMARRVVVGWVVI